MAHDDPRALFCTCYDDLHDWGLRVFHSRHRMHYVLVDAAVIRHFRGARGRHQRARAALMVDGLFENDATRGFCLDCGITEHELRQWPRAQCLARPRITESIFG